MSNGLNDYIKEHKIKIELYMDNAIKDLDSPVNLKDSMHYSLMAGGKRLRPILLIASYEAYNNDIEVVMSSACALEMIHTYSLIHDDLPAMDDDDLRRGKLTNHKKFNEATAILAGDALLTYSFQIIAEDPLLNFEQKTYLISLIAKCSGPEGMVKGQILDIEAEMNRVELDKLEKVHEHKTGKLITFAIIAGAYLAGANDKELKNLEEFSYYLGLIFQLQDDILDIIGDLEKLGKPVGSDEANDKSTYPNLLGLDGAIEQKEIYIKRAENALSKTTGKHKILKSLMDHFSNRDH